MAILKLIAELLWFIFVAIPTFILVSLLVSLLYTILYVKNNLFSINKKLTKKNY